MIGAGAGGVVVLIALSLAIAFMETKPERRAREKEQARAIEAGVGRYEVDHATGAVEFVYGVEKEQPEGER